MKRHSILAIIMVCAISLQAQTTRTFVFHRGGQPILSVPISQVDSIVFVTNGEDVEDPEDPTPDNPTPDNPTNGVSKCTDAHHPHAIDLGLPSGIKWACCNVGAKNPKEYGGYYAWSETETKQEYNWENYKYCIAWDGNSSWDWNKHSDHFYFTKYVTNESYGEIDNKVVLDLEDDAARVIHGAPWRMPTQEEMQELVDKCKWTWKTMDGVNGYEVKGPNGNTIFLPAAGSYNFGNELSNAYDEGFYYTSSLYEPHCKGALYLYFNTGEKRVTIFDSYFDRRDGRTIRGICK
jgi:hypothetical protein